MTHMQFVETLAEPIAEAYRRLSHPVLLISTDGGAGLEATEL